MQERRVRRVGGREDRERRLQAGRPVCAKAREEMVHVRGKPRERLMIWRRAGLALTPV